MSTEIQATVVPMLPILAAPQNVKEPAVLVYFRRKKVAEADSYRGVIVPDGYKLPTPVYQTVAVDGTGAVVDTQVEFTDAEEIFGDAIQEAFLSAAGEILKSYVESNKDAKEIPAGNLAFSAVVARMQENATSQRLNGEQIAEWYKDSDTAKDAATRYGTDEKGKQKAALLAEKYASLASNNPAISADLAGKMLAYMSANDLTSTVAKAVAKRLERLTKVDTADDL